MELLRPSGAKKRKEENSAGRFVSTGFASGRIAAVPLHPRLHSFAPLGRMKSERKVGTGPNGSVHRPI
jgi:hypothetical protein